MGSVRPWGPGNTIRAYPKSFKQLIYSPLYISLCWLFVEGVRRDPSKEGHTRWEMLDQGSQLLQAFPALSGFYNWKSCVLGTLSVLGKTKTVGRLSGEGLWR